MKKVATMLVAGTCLCVALHAEPLGPREAYVLQQDLSLWQEQAGSLAPTENLTIGDKVDLLDRSEKFTRHGQQQNYVRVRAPDGKEGWVQASLVAPRSSLGVVKAEGGAAVSRGPQDAKLTGKVISFMSLVAILPDRSMGTRMKVTCFDVPQSTLFGDATWVAAADLSTETADVRAVILYRVAAASKDPVVRQNALQRIERKYGASLFLQKIQDALGVRYTWTEHAPNGELNWTAVASSADGTRLAACVGGGALYLSSDTGARWSRREPAGSKSWTAVVSSADGMRLAAGAWEGGIYTSSDGGATWHPGQGAPLRGVSAVASSHDGMRLVACVKGSPQSAWQGYLYTSADGGATWTEQRGCGSRGWTSVASSSDGLRLVACAGGNRESGSGGAVYTSTDGGSTWTARTIPGTEGRMQWTAVACSSGGSRLFLAASGGGIYSSEDSGETWVDRTAAGRRAWTTLGCSADGTTVMACTPGEVIVSRDGGATWMDRNAGAWGWRDVALSSDGGRAVACAGNSLFLTADFGDTWVSLGVSGTRNWASVTSSSDGRALAAGNGNGFIYTSTNAGVTWTENAAGPLDCISISSSTDGARLGVVIPRRISLSNDGGRTWTEQTGAIDWTSIALSGNGSRIAISSATLVNLEKMHGEVRTSSDGGISWTLGAEDPTPWSSVAISADGTCMAAGGEAGVLMTFDAGRTWSRTRVGLKYPTAVALSSDGTRTVVCNWDDGIYASTDHGRTWIAHPLAGDGQWRSIACSADGMVIAACMDRGPLVVSTDGGVTWARQAAAGNRAWWSVACSADGSQIFACVNGGNLFIGKVTLPAPTAP